MSGEMVWFAGGRNNDIRLGYFGAQHLMWERERGEEGGMEDRDAADI